jgi:hypothetical protein
VTSPIACTLTAPDLIARREELAARLLPAIEEVAELPDGYALRFPGGREWVLELSEFVAFERECCRFLHFELDFRPEQGPIWLRLRGGEGVKEFIAAAFLPPEPL